MHFITASNGKSVLGATPEATRKSQHVRGVAHQFDASCGSRSPSVPNPIGWKDVHGNALSTDPSFGHGIGPSRFSRQEPIGTTPQPRDELYRLPKHVLVSEVSTARHGQIHFPRQASGTQNKIEKHGSSLITKTETAERRGQMNLDKQRDDGAREIATEIERILPQRSQATPPFAFR